MDSGVNRLGSNSGALAFFFFGEGFLFGFSSSGFGTGTGFGVASGMISARAVSLIGILLSAANGSLDFFGHRRVYNRHRPLSEIHLSICKIEVKLLLL